MGKKRVQSNRFRDCDPSAQVSYSERRARSQDTLLNAHRERIVRDSQAYKNVLDGILDGPPRINTKQLGDRFPLERVAMRAVLDRLMKLSSDVGMEARR